LVAGGGASSLDGLASTLMGYLAKGGGGGAAVTEQAAEGAK
jgi:hypothetical protein